MVTYFTFLVSLSHVSYDLVISGAELGAEDFALGSLVFNYFTEEISSVRPC